MSSSSLDQLPVEIFFGICRYLDVPDILRIRRVSRYLNEISRSKDVWADAYRKANFVCPPGPFPSQSGRDLENALVPGFRVAQTLRHSGTENERLPRKLGEIQCSGVALHVSLAFGRFLLIALSGELRCYDLHQVNGLNSDTGASILYRPTAGRTLASFYCVSAIGIDGRSFTCVVLKEEDGPKKQAQISIYVLDTKKQSTVTLDLVHRFECGMFNIHSVDLGPRTIIVQGSVTPPPMDDRSIVVLDVRARIKFVLPITDEMWKIDEKPEDSSFFISSVSTSTHIILARSFYISAAGWSTVFNSYALPPSTTHATSTLLKLSHRGIIPDSVSDHLVLLRDAIFVPTTHDIRIMIRLSTFDSSCCDVPLLKYGTLCLRKSRSGEVGTITFQALGPLGRFPRDLFNRPSFNGIGRAFYLVPPWAHGTVAALEYDIRGGEEYKLESRVRVYPSILRFSTPCRLLDFDPYCGRICLQSAVKRYNIIEIWDLCVERCRTHGVTKRMATP